MDDACRDWKGRLAEHVLHEPGPMDPALRAHLDHCAECRAAMDELRATTRALRDADPARPAPPVSVVAHDLAVAISARIEAERMGERRRRIRRRVLTGTLAAACIVAVVIAASVILPLRRADPDTVTLSGDTIDAEAYLGARHWGTQVRIEGDGFLPGNWYQVWLERQDGSRVSAGSFSGVRGARIVVVLASALPAGQAVAIGISEEGAGDLLRQPLSGP